MNKTDVIKQIREIGIIPVVRATTADEAMRAIDAIREGGISVFEITMTVPNAFSVIEQVTTRFGSDALVGAGTVLDVEDAKSCIASGAQFVVSPALNPEAARLCNRYQIPYMPGSATPREVIEAMECGADIVKVFPGDTLGPSFVKAIRGPLPQASLMPTGGVDISNVADWIKAGCVAVGVGGNLTASAKTGDFKTITTLAKQFIEKIRGARA